MLWGKKQGVILTTCIFVELSLNEIYADEISAQRASYEQKGLDKRINK